MSATYRQSSKTRPELEAKDPDNTPAGAAVASAPARGTDPRRGAGSERASESSRSAARASARRSRTGSRNSATDAKTIELEGEQGRGPLSPRAVHPLPAHHAVPVAGQLRCARSRRFRCASRERSNTPLQALNLLNDPVFFEAAASAGACVTRGGRRTPEPASDMLSSVALARDPEPRDRAAPRLPASAESNRSAEQKSASERYSALDGVDLSRWPRGYRRSVLLNLDEFITRE